MDIVDEIKKKQKQIENLEKERANQEGQEKQLLKQLEVETGVDSVEEGEEELERLGQELVENEKRLKELDFEMGEIISAATISVEEKGE